MNLIEILSWLRDVAPEDTAISGDPVGLLVHSADRDITHAAVCLDATSAIVKRASCEGVQLVVCHHPLIYRPLSTIRYADPIGQAITTLVTEGIALYAMHTNWDLAHGGVNDTLAGVLGLGDVRPLKEVGDARLARIGEISAQPLNQFAATVNCVLDTTGESALRYSKRFCDRIVRTIAVCGGAGAFLLPEALASGADALLTSDVRHHEFVDADGRNAILIDAGHGATERPGMAHLARLTADRFPGLRVTFLA